MKVMRRFPSLYLDVVACVYLVFSALDVNAQTVNICERTPQVKDEILSRTSGSDCTNVAAAELSDIIELRFWNEGITSLKDGDFDGLSSLDLLEFEKNSLTDLPANILDGLSNLRALHLDRNSLPTIPKDLFDNLTRLELLDMNSNSLANLDENLFEGLSGLKYLYLFNNSLTDLDEDLFEGLSKLYYLFLADNSLTDLDEDLFEGLNRLEKLDLQNNSLTTLHENIFDGIRDGLTVYLDGNPIRCLPQKILDLRESGAITIFIHFSRLKPCADPTLVVTLDLASEEISEAGGSTTVTAHLSAPSSVETSIMISAAATIPATDFDYTLSSNPRLRIAAGAVTSTGTVTLTAVDNDVDEPNKTVTVSGQVTNAQGVMDPEKETLTIVNDDEATRVTLSVVPHEVDEDAGTENVTVTAALDVLRSTDTVMTIFVESSTANSRTDFTPVHPFPLTILAKDREGTGIFPFTPISDGIDEPVETVQIIGTTGVDGLEVSTATLKLLDTDPIPEVTLVLTPEAISESGESTTISALMSPASSQATVIEVSAVPDSPATPKDYMLSSNNTLIVESGAMVSTGEVSITALDNLVEALNKTVTVSGQARNSLGVTNPSDKILTILNDDLPSGITLTVDPVEVNEDGGTVQIMVTAALDVLRSTDTVMTIFVESSTADSGTDFTLVHPFPLTILAKDREGTGIFLFTPISDGIDEPVETVQIIGTTGVDGLEVSTATLKLLDTDPIPEVTLVLTPEAISESGESTTISALMSPASSQATVIEVSAVPDSPATPKDYMLSSNNTLIVESGAMVSTGEVSITALDNLVEALNKTVTVSGQARNSLGVTNPSDKILTILNDDLPLGSTLMVDPVEVNEDEGTVQIMVTVTLDVAQAVDTNVTITLGSGTATSGVDFEEVDSFQLMIMANELEGNTVFNLTLLDDLIYEPSETIAISGNSMAFSQSETLAYLTIIDNDHLITLAIWDTIVSEEVGEAQIRIEVNPAAPTELYIPIQTIANSATEVQDYVAPDDNLHIPEGSKTVFVKVPILDDQLFEGEETFQIQLMEVEGIVLDPGESTVTIEDDDLYELQVGDALALESKSEMTFEITLNPPNPVQTVRVAFETAGETALEPVDYMGQSGMLVFPRGTHRREVSVPIIDDTEEEMEETFLLRLSAPEYAVLSTVEARGTILDDDALSVVDIEESMTVREEAGQALFSVTLSRVLPGRDTQVEFSVLDETANAPLDYRVLTPSPLRFISGETTKTIVVQIMDDEIHEGEETFRVQLSDAQNGVLGQDEAQGIILDNEDPVTAIIRDAEVTESETEAVFEVELSGLDSKPRTFGFSTEDASALSGQDYEAVAGEIIFAPGELLKEIRVPILDNLETEPTETFRIRLSSADFSNLEATGTIQDDDVPLTVSIYDEQASEGDGLLLLPIRLNRASSELVTVRYTSSDDTAEEGSDYVSSQGIVIFQWGSTEGKIRIQILEDSEVESDETFQVTLSNARHAEIAQETGTGTILDNDGSPTVSVQSVTVSRQVAMFDMHLSKPSPLPILISYATEDGSALAGEDYEPLAGQVAFEPSEVSKTIEVKLLASERIWEAKTFSLVLLSAVNAEVAQARTEAVVEEESEENIQNAYVSRVLRTWASQIVDAFSRRMEGMARCSIPDLSWLRYGTARRSLGDIFRGCGAEFTQGGWSVWGQGAFTRMNGRDGALSLRSDVTSMILGADYAWDQGWMAGLLAAQSWDQGTYETPAWSGTASSRLTGIYPYISYQTGTGMRAWLLLGLGRGETELETLESELDAALVALGLTGILTRGSTGQLGYKVDAFWATADMENGSELGVRRVRAGVEGSLRLGAGMQPYLETALRQDGGDAETGMGMELGGGVRWSTSQLRAEVGGRTLVLHTDEGLREWGLMGSVEYGSPGGLGPSMRVRPLWGNAYGGDLWREAPLHSIGLGNTDQRVEMELGYGMAIRESLGRSIVGMTMDPSGRAYRVGYNLRMKEGLQVSVATTARTMEANRTPHSYGLSARMDLNW